MRLAPFASVLFGAVAIYAAVPAHTSPTLKEAFRDDFLIGAAVNRRQFFEDDLRGVPLIKAQFNSITPENILKWEFVHALPGRYNFDAPDRYVAFGETNHMTIIGHTLVWHERTPKWVFQNEDGTRVDRETLLRRMHDHIQTVVGRYQGRIKGWDVVNEALNEDGTLRQSPWMKIIGEDYIAKAFEYAHEADPKADLHYNDYSLEKEPKRNGAIALLQKLKARGVPVTGVGLQGHMKMDWPTPEEEDATIAAFAKLGLKVMITELDIDVVPATQKNRTADIAQNAQPHAESNAYADGLPQAVQQALAKRYADLFAVFLKHREVVNRVTFWGVTDGDSWLNFRARVNHPLLFDRSGQPKPAFDAVIRSAAQGAHATETKP
ncbi:MAG TPA: endo-1,4-beta-xylanase [Candidatus Binatia bacterium]|jgi:endo-1,4-beta-xylanase|nr:endo-1,4-beta-xylanase [Candidatus Binatia bacterium]